MADRLDVEKDPRLLDPVVRNTPGFYLTVAVLLSVMGWALYNYITQVRYGLGVTGLNRPVFWGFYITNFVFFIGISHAGTLISAILRICQAEWRRSITRAAEVITVMVLFFGVGNILADMGRPDRLLNIAKHASFRSPLLWDVCSVTTYMLGSITYLYLPLIPDIAFMRDNIKKRRRLYRILALGWTGTKRQFQILEKAISIMAVIILPIAVSVHTVVSFVFSMTIQPMWHSTIFGPYFVAGAIFSGIAALIIGMALIRKFYHLEDYIRDVHFDNLGKLLLVMTLAWFYFTFAEYLTAYYGAEPVHMTVFWAKINGPYKVHFWTMVVCCFIVPFSLLCNRRTRNIYGTVIASIGITIGMWLERFTIVVPTLINPRLPYDRGIYMPTMVEVSITAGSFAAFIFFYLMFTKFFPIVSIWEVKEGKEEGVAQTVERMRTYFPGDVRVLKDSHVESA